MSFLFLLSLGRIVVNFIRASVYALYRDGMSEISAYKSHYTLEIYSISIYPYVDTNDAIFAAN